MIALMRNLIKVSFFLALNFLTRARNNRKYAENKKAYESYTAAYAGVKVVNDAYKAGGAEALQNIDLFKKTPEETTKPTITVGEVTGGIIRE